MDARAVVSRDDRAQVVRLAVVDDDAPAKLARLVGPQERLELAPSGALREAAGDEDRHALPCDPYPRQLCEHRGERVPPRIVPCGRKRQRGRLDDDGRATAARGEGRERLPRKRIQQRLGNRGADVCEGVEGRRGTEQHRVVRQRDEREPRAGVEGDPGHRRAS